MSDMNSRIRGMARGFPEGGGLSEIEEHERQEETRAQVDAALRAEVAAAEAVKRRAARDLAAVKARQNINNEIRAASGRPVHKEDE